MVLSGVVCLWGCIIWFSTFVYIWEYSLGKLLETLQHTHTHTHTHTHGGMWENKQKLRFKFYKSFQFTQSKLGFSLDGHWSLCWVVSIIQFPRNLINLVYSMNRFSIWSVVKTLSSLLFLILWAFRWAVGLLSISQVCTVLLGELSLPAHPPPVHPLSSGFHPFAMSEDSDILWDDRSPGISPSDRVDEVWNFMKISGDLWWQVPFSLGQRWPRPRAELGPALLALGPSPFSCLPHCCGHHLLVQGPLSHSGVNSEWIREP